MTKPLNRESGWEIALVGMAQNLFIWMARSHCVPRYPFESFCVAVVRG